MSSLRLSSSSSLRVEQKLYTTALIQRQPLAAMLEVTPAARKEVARTSDHAGA